MSREMRCSCCGTTSAERWNFQPAYGWRCDACARKCDPRTSFCNVLRGAAEKPDAAR